jgi:hypothetical protein
LKGTKNATASFLKKASLNRLDEALASYDMALKHNPTHSNAINNRKILLEKLKSK